MKFEFLVTNRYKMGVVYPWGRKFWPQRACTFTTSRFSMWWILGGSAGSFSLLTKEVHFLILCTIWCLSWPVENLPYLMMKELYNQHFTFWINEFVLLLLPFSEVLLPTRLSYDHCEYLFELPASSSNSSCRLAYCGCSTPWKQQTEEKNISRDIKAEGMLQGK